MRAGSRTGVLAVGAFGPRAPSFRVRIELPAPALAAHGVDMVPMPLFTAEEAARFRVAGAGAKARIVLTARSRLLASLPSTDEALRVTLIHRQVDMLPFMQLENAAADGRRVVLDVDDAVWLDTTRGAHGHPLAFIKGTSRKIRRLAASADQVIAGNEVLGEWLGRHARDVAIVPSLVDPAGVAMRTHVEAPRLRLGWIGSPASAAHLHALAGVLSRAASVMRGVDLELLVVGARAPVVENLRTISWPWDERRELDALASMDIGLMPLEDTPFARGKCAYKSLQYMAAGVPVIADDVGVSARVIGDGAAGIIARSPGDWVDAIVRLAGDPDLRTALGAEGRRRVEESYSVQRWAGPLARLLTG
jgi:hypothetical protein